MGITLAQVVIEGIAELGPPAVGAVRALIDHFRKQQNLAPIDWAKYDAQFAKDLEAAKEAAATAKATPAAAEPTEQPASATPEPAATTAQTAPPAEVESLKAEQPGEKQQPETD